MLKKKWVKYLSVLLVLVSFSCSNNIIILENHGDSVKPDIVIKVKGTKGKVLVGTKRKIIYDRFYEGKLKEGWTRTSDIVDKFPYSFFSKESFERSLYKNAGLTIDNITSKTTDRFQFTVSDSLETWLAFCSQLYEGKSTNYDIRKQFDFSTGKSQKSDFKVTFISLYDTLTPKWDFALGFKRETPDGFIQTFLKEGMPVESGHLNNGIDTIFIKPLFIKGKQIGNNQYIDIIKIVGGYEFVHHNTTIGMVDLYQQSISLYDLRNKHNSIVNASATALLLRIR